MRSVLVLITLCAALKLDASAQGGKVEAPSLFTERFSPAQYDAHNQNWAVLQDDRGVVYVGNTSGVLEYDGRTWRTVTSEVEHVRSLARDESGVIFVGGRGEIGWLVPDSMGVLRYESLIHHLPLDARDFVDVWTTHATSDGVYFQSFGQIMRWADGRFHVWNTSNRYHKAFEVRDRFYVREEGVGLLATVGDELKLTPGGERFAETKVDALLSHSGDILVLTRDEGFLLRNGQTQEYEFVQSEVDNYLRVHRPYSAVAIPVAGGRSQYAISTIGGGVAVIDEEGQLVRTLREKARLETDDLVLDVYPDTQGGLWLALNNGIVRVAVPSPVSHFGRDLGLEGVVSGAGRVEGELYAATAVGLFRLEPDAVQFRAVGGLDPFDPQVWDLDATGGKDALVAASSGVYALTAGRLRLVRPGISFAVHRPAAKPDVAYVGTKTDLLRFVRAQGTWRFDRIELANAGEVRSITEDDRGALWLSTREGALIRHHPSERSHERFTDDERIPEGYKEVALLDRQLVLVSSEGEVAVLRTSDRTSLDARAEMIQRRLDEMGSGPVSIHAAGGDRLVVARGTRVKVLYFDEDRVRDVTPSVLFRVPSVVRTVVAEADGQIWLGTDEGLLRYDPSVPDRLTSSYAALVRGVSFGERQAFGGTYWDGEATLTPQPGFSLEAAFEDRDIRVTYAAPSFNLGALTEYQVRLDGYSEAWTEWSQTAFKEYTNLSEGSYVFRVRARNAQGIVSEEGVVRFEILPPWYRTWWAYASYALLGIAFVWFVSAWRVREHRHRLAVQKARSARLRRLNDRLQLTNESLRASDRLKDDLLANTSHELRTPLTAVLGFSEMLLESHDPEARDLAEGIQRGGERLLNTVNGLLDMFKLQSGTLKLMPEEVDAAALVRGTVGLLQPLAADRQLDLRVHPADLLLPARLDRDALDRIVTNLVGNALKFTNEGGVTVTVDADSEHVTLSVVDSGIGIPEEFLPNLFTPFEQASTGVARTHEGTGLGLAIVHQLVRLMGGEMNVDSQEGVGTMFQVQIPRWASPRADVVGTAAALASPSRAGGSLLTIGLGPDDGRCLRLWVDPKGTLCETDTIGRALREMRQEAFDVVLLHPEDGETDRKRTRLIRRVPGYDHIPLIRVGGGPLPAKELLARGFTHQLDAPIQDDELTTLLESLLMQLELAMVTSV